MFFYRLPESDAGDTKISSPMKIKYLVAGVIAVSFTAGDAIAENSRFWSFYNGTPTNAIGSEEWWNGDVMLGDWWGIRNGFEDTGVEFSLTYTNNIAGNPVGGKSQGFTYTDNIGFGATFDMEKLIGWEGAALTVSGLNRSGSSLSQDNIGNQFTVQQVFGGQTAMFYALFIEQRMFDDTMTLKLGRFATGDDFASSPLYWYYMNNGIDGNPQALPVNTQFSAYPWAVWAARLRADISEEFNAMAGVYQVSTRVFDREYHGMDWSIRPDDGVLMIGQVGWTPEFFKRPVTTSAADGKSTTDQKSFKSASVVPEMAGLPGHYWMGAYYSPWQFQQFGSDETASNSYGFYWHADQMVFQESPGSLQGLTLWTASVLSPQQNIAKLPFQLNAGAVYVGLVPGRGEDATMLGFVYGKFSRDFARSVDVNGAGFPEYEIVLEAGHRFQINRFLYAQPNVQWVINPGGTGNIPNALVLGAQVGVTF